MVRSEVIRQRRVDDDGLVERVGRAWCMPRRKQRRGTGARERVSFLKCVYRLLMYLKVPSLQLRGQGCGLGLWATIIEI